MKEFHSASDLAFKDFNSTSVEFTKLKLPSIGFQASCIENRRPNTVFTGPTGLRDQRQTVLDPHNVGIGRFSNLRSYDTEYLTRGKHNILGKERKTFPGEVGWSCEYFRKMLPNSVSNRQYPNKSVYYNPR